MTEKELDIWFSDITVKQKEHIACKVLLKDGKDAKDGVYPKCTRVWCELTYDRKLWIHEHCTDRHGMWAVEENEETAMGHDF